jgi:hypothetical protein
MSRKTAREMGKIGAYQGGEGKVKVNGKGPGWEYSAENPS